MKIDVYTTKRCVQCKMVKKRLYENELKYNVIDIEENDDARELLKALGYQSVPVMIVDGQEPVVGFRPNVIDKLKGGN